MTETEQPRQGRLEYPVYTSIAAASAASGIPVVIFRDAKARGCPAFVHSRVYMQDFLRWYFDPEKNTEGGKKELLDLTQARAQESTERAKAIARDNALADKQIVTMQEAQEHVRNGLIAARQMFDALPSEMAPKVNPEQPAFAMEQLQEWSDSRIRMVNDAIMRNEEAGAKSIERNGTEEKGEE